jgi:hypothetical protein
MFLTKEAVRLAVPGVVDERIQGGQVDPGEGPEFRSL